MDITSTLRRIVPENDIIENKREQEYLP